MVVQRRRNPLTWVRRMLLAILVASSTEENHDVAAQQQQQQQQQHHYSVADSYPIEFGTLYDPMVIDPHRGGAAAALHHRGAVYGGYSRASREALARLPLVLPETSSSLVEEDNDPHDDDDDDEMSKQSHSYFRVRDHGGQLFACRLYHEDALEPSSLYDSMFDAPVLMRVTTVATTVTTTGNIENVEPKKNTDGGMIAPTTTATTTPKMVDGATTVTPAQIGAATAAAEEKKKKKKKKTAIPGSSLQPTTRVIRSSSTNKKNVESGGMAGSSSSVTGSTTTATSSSTGTTTTTTGGGTISSSSSSSSASSAASSSSSRALVQMMESTSADDYDDVDDDDDDTIDPVVIEMSLMEHLQGVCGQVHKGYWSYEWCFMGEITQFHVEYDTKTNQVKVDRVTNLGTYARRDLQLIMMNRTNNDNDDDFLFVNEWAQDEPEVARVVDYHLDGTLCDATEPATPRRTHAILQCCGPKVVKRHKGMVHRDRRPFLTDLVAVLDVVEDPDLKCTYNFTICTPLLCGDTATTDTNAAPADDDATAAAAAAEKAAVDAARLVEDLNGSSKINDEESIRQILDRTLTQLCLQSSQSGGGWWTYEFCHEKSIRQFHETLGVRKNSAGAKVASKVVESEHVLGKYDPASEAHVQDGEEYKYVVNATSTTSSTSTTSTTNVAVGTSWGEGNGAYYQVEYTGGDTCDTSDVTDSAIVAGTAGKTTMLRRAASVRYHCGSAFDVQVSEDSTCHYIVDVKVPGLCRHPLFRAPISKRQIMKCLPVDNEEEDDF